MASSNVVKIYLNRDERTRLLMPSVLSLLFASRLTRTDVQEKPWIWFLFLFLAIVISIMLLKAFTDRLEITESEVRIFSIFQRKRSQFTWKQVSNYLSTPLGHWFFNLEGKAQLADRYQFRKLHKQVLIHARPALRGVRAIQNQLPPTENFVNRWAFDIEEFLGGKEYFIGMSAAYLCLGKLVIAVPAFLILLLLFVIHELANRISIDENGLASSSLSGTVFIPWNEVEAVFRERRKYSRGFTVIAGDKAIFVPPKLCENVELVRKLLFSLPEGTLMVNFKGKIPRRPRRRIRKRLPLRRPKQEALQPTF